MDDKAPDNEPIEPLEVPEEAPADVENQELEAEEPRRGEIRYRFASGKVTPQLRVSAWWRELLLGFFVITAVVFFINPFTNLALSVATTAEPTDVSTITLPNDPEQGYCLAGGFQDWDGESTPLLDDGTEGDTVAGDGVYSRLVILPEPQRYLWRVLPCGDWASAVATSTAWIFAEETDQAVIFSFNPHAQEGDEWPSSYYLTADDPFPNGPVVVGSFQPHSWDNKDYQTRMTYTGDGIFELAYSVALPGTYEASVSIEGYREGFGADGRSTNPIPLQFSTHSSTELVVFRYNPQTDRIAIYYEIPSWLSWLGFDIGDELIAAVSFFGALVMAALVTYHRVILNPKNQERAGCPQCQHTPLKRINRTVSDYVLNLFGIPVRRYKCTECGWNGRRIRL